MLPKSYLVFKWLVYASATLLFFALQSLVLNHIRVLGLTPFLYPLLHQIARHGHRLRNGLVPALSPCHHNGFPHLAGKGRVQPLLESQAELVSAQPCSQYDNIVRPPAVFLHCAGNDQSLRYRKDEQQNRRNRKQQLFESCDFC